MSTPPSDAATTVIRPLDRFAPFGLGELWRERELVFYLALRAVKVRYKQTALGAAWAFLQPFVTMVVFTIVLHRIGKVSAHSVPYPILAYSALVVWYFFAGAVTLSAGSLVANAGMLQKIYFPRLALPLSAVLATLVDFVASGLLLVGMMVWYGVPANGWAVLLLPVFLLIALVAATGAGLLLSALYVRFRDIQYALPFVLQILLLVTPIGYTLEFMTRRIAEPWRTLYELNPMVGVAQGFRWALTGEGTMSLRLGLLSAASALVLLGAGLVYFKRTEIRFADVA